MKFQTWAVILMLGTSVAARGGLYTYNSSPNANIPDGSTAGWSQTLGVNNIPSGMTVGDVTVSFTISGGFNGDLYGYLSHDGALIPLLNRVGMGTGLSTAPAYSFGYGDAGFNNVTLADGASVNIHNYGGGVVPNGTYAPDSSGATFAGTYGGLSANGSWTHLLCGPVHRGRPEPVDKLEPGRHGRARAGERRLGDIRGSLPARPLRPEPAGAEAGSPLAGSLRGVG